MSANNTTVRLEHLVAKLTERSEAVAVGRAAWGLYALLSIWKGSNLPQKIALPSFLCQSPLAAVLLAGWEPEFCDIDLATGNVSVAEWQRVIDSGVQAVLFVHLFGNVGDAEQIAELCRVKGVHFVEDAAQSFGGSWKGQQCGSHGDAAIISFGHTKTIDVGQGGLVLTNDARLAWEIRGFWGHEVDFISDNSLVARHFREKFYSARRLLGNAPVAARNSFRGLVRIYEPLIHAHWNPGVSEEIVARIKSLHLNVMERREKNEIYKEILRDTALVPLKMSSGSTPWRAVFRLPGIGWAEQEAISDAVRKEGVDISNWYIPSHWLMDGAGIPSGKLEATERLSAEIFQLWVDAATGTEKVRSAASVLISKLSEVGYV